MKIYHYSKLRNWRDIKSGSYKSKDEPGLGANRRMGREDREAWETGAVFALLEPEPADWVENQEFPHTWDYLKYDIGELLLEIEVDPEKDSNVFVVDWAQREGILWEDKENIPQKYLHETRKESERAYMESKIPLQEYLERKDELNYSLPEIVITENVPLEKISISESQPRLEEELKRYKGELRAQLVRDIERVPELSEWYHKYLQEREPTEGREGGFLRG